MKVLGILLLSMTLACGAQTTPATTPTIKGHTLGESVQQFTANADDFTRGLISTCVTKSRAYPALKAAADAAKAAYAPYAGATRDSRAGRAAYDAYGATAPAAYNADPSRETGCPEYLTIVNTGSGELSCTNPEMKMGMCRNFDGHATFVGNKLVDVDIEVYGAQFEDVLADTEAKFGKPEETHTSTMQNAYGAKFDVQVANWTAPGYMAVLIELISTNMTKYPMLKLIDRAYYGSQHKPHGSVLD